MQRKSFRQGRRQSHVSMESLEPRVVLAATATNGVLSVTGTENADRIGIKLDGTNLVVKVNAEESRFEAASITEIQVECLGGNDRVVLERGVNIPALINGGAGNDELNGGGGNDTLSGGDGNDRIRGLAGNDQLDGGAGNDRTHGDQGDDLVDGGAGDDLVTGDDGKDALYGGAGRDGVEGGAADDVLFGGDDGDRLLGGDGNDILNGDAGDDVLDGMRGADAVFGGDGNDTLIGNSSDDSLDGGAGTNTTRDRPQGPRTRPTPEQIDQAIATRAAEIFARLDGNADGVITQDEVTAEAWTRLSRADADTNGQVTLDELKAQIKAQMEANRGRGGRSGSGGRGTPA